MGKELQKALLVIMFFLLIFTLMPSGWNRVGDFNFHFNRAGGNCPEGYSDASCASYYPLLHLLGSVFSFSEQAFSNFLMIIVLFITPMILFFMTKKWMVVWLYYSVTQYVYLIQAGGAYPQALAGIFLLLFLWQKNNYLRFFILIGAIISHSNAFTLLLMVWLVQLFFENNIHKIIYKKFKYIFPACSAIFGRQDVDPIGQKILITTITKNGIEPINIIVKDIANFFIRTFPFPFLLAAFWQLKKEKEWALIVLTIFGFYYGFAVGQARIFLIIPLILLPSLTRFYYNLDNKWKKWFIGLSIITFLINFGTWGLYKVQCLA